MAQPVTGPSQIHTQGRTMAAELALWANEVQVGENRFRDTEARELDAYLNAQTAVRAKFEDKKRALSAKLSPEEAKELSDITESAAQAELAKLRQEYDDGRLKRGRQHDEDVRVHHEKIQSLVSRFPPDRAAASPYATQTQHSNAAYPGSTSTQAYPPYSTPAPATAVGHNSPVAVTSAPGYSAHASQPRRHSPLSVGELTQPYNTASQAYQHSSAAHIAPAPSGALQHARTEENRSAAYQPATLAASRELHPGQPTVGTSEQRRVSNQWTPATNGVPAQPSVPSYFVLPSQRNQSDVSSAQPNPSQMADPAVKPAFSQQPAAGRNPLPGRRAVLEDTMPNRTRRRSSLVASSLSDKNMEYATGSLRAKRKADEHVESPLLAFSKRTKVVEAADSTEKDRRPRTAGSDTSGASGQMATPRRQSGQKQAAAGRRTITFDEVYQGGNPRFKHLIIEFPANSAAFYVLRCDEHEVHFNATNPLAGAAKHLASAQHGHMTKEHAKAVEHLGWQIVDGTYDKVRLNNEMVKAAFENGYKPHNLNVISKRDRKSMEAGNLAREVQEPLASTPAGRRPPSRRLEKAIAPSVVSTPIAKRPPPGGITNPTPGQLYRAHWSMEKRNYAVLVLPWGDLAQVGYSGTLGTTGLLDDAPKCYVIDRSVPQITAWAQGYEDGGMLVDKREFPVCYFDDKTSVGWVRARDLQEFDFSDPKSVPNFEDAVNHLEKIKQYALETQTGTPAEDNGTVSSGKENAEARKESKEPDASTSAEAEPREDIVMTDAWQVKSSRAEPVDDDSDSDHPSDLSGYTDHDAEITDSRRTSISNKARSLGNTPTPDRPSPLTRVSFSQAASADIEKTTQSRSPQAVDSQDRRQVSSGSANAPAPEPGSTATHINVSSAVFPDRAPVESSQKEAVEKTSRRGATPAAQRSPVSPQAKLRGSKSPIQSGDRSRTPADSGSSKSPAPDKEADSITVSKPTIFAAGLGPQTSVATIVADTTGEKWRAVRSASDDTNPKPQSANTRPKSAGSVTGLRSALAQSPMMTPAPSTRASSPTQQRSSYPPSTELFDIASFEDDRMPGKTPGSLILSFNKSTKVFEGSSENGTAVVVDVSKIDKIVRRLNDPEKDPEGRTVVATIHYPKDGQGEHKQVLVFKPRDPMGKGTEIGAIHARRLARLASSVNHQIDNINTSND